MAGGPGTPQLAAAVSAAGGLGFLPGGYVSPERLKSAVDTFRTLSGGPMAINLFVPAQPSATRMQEALRYAGLVHRWADVRGVPLGEPAYDDDAFEAKVGVALEARPEVVSFTFGLPAAGVTEALQAAGVVVAVTVTSAAEAAAAEEAGADALVVQGSEAGAHRGGWMAENGEPLGLLVLLQLVRASTSLPMVATGGIASGAAIASVLAAGADAAMLGTAFMRCPEAGTTPVHADELPGEGATTLTRAFTGRPARAMRNEFVDALGPLAPAAYPEVHFLTAPMRAAARERQVTDYLHLWAGQAHSLARDVPARELVGQLVVEARAAAARLPAMLADTPDAAERVDESSS
jgi:nitronate monooxygenase